MASAASSLREVRAAGQSFRKGTGAEVTASYRDGVLEVRMPKPSSEGTARRIEIVSGAADDESRVCRFACRCQIHGIVRPWSGRSLGERRPALVEPRPSQVPGRPAPGVGRGPISVDRPAACVHHRRGDRDARLDGVRGECRLVHEERASTASIVAFFFPMSAALLFGLARSTWWPAGWRAAPSAAKGLFAFLRSRLLRLGFSTVLFIGVPPTWATALKEGNSRGAFISSLTGETPRRQDQTLLLPKIDWQINQNNLFTVSYNRLRAESPAGLQTQATNTLGRRSFGDDFVDVDNLNVRLQTTFSTNILNEARFQYSQDHEQRSARSRFPESRSQRRRSPVRVRPASAFYERNQLWNDRKL